MPLINGVSRRVARDQRIETQEVNIHPHFAEGTATRSGPGQWVVARAVARLTRDSVDEPGER
jgi:hypothetical protein